MMRACAAVLRAQCCRTCARCMPRPSLPVAWQIILFSRLVSSWPPHECFINIRALASTRGSVATRRVATGPRARGQRARPLEGPKGRRVAQTCESEGPKGPRTSKAKCPSRCLPVLLYVFHNSAQNREIHEPFSRP